MLEVAVVILLVLAMAAITLPVAASWFSDAADERMLDSIVLAIRDEQREAMLTRTPRALWIDADADADAGAGAGAGAGVDPSPSESASPPRGRSDAAARWSLGGETLGSRGPAEGASSAGEVAIRPRRAAIDLPRGWSLAIDSAAPPSSAETPVEAAALDVAAGSRDDDQSRFAVFWPGGQVDVLGILQVRNGRGAMWSVEIDPWTGVPAWRVRTSQADRATAVGRPSSPSPTEAWP